jgi:CubicO group peptidase (beta-lactamase class C family)
MMKTKLTCQLIIVLVSTFVTGCLKDKPVKLAYAGFKPMVIEDYWTVSTPAEQDMNEEYLNTAYQLIYNDERFVMAHSLLVIRNGKLVAEAYPHDPDDAYKTENIQSCTKSFTSILTGIALEKNILDSLNQTFSSIYPDYFMNHEDKKDIKIVNALTMKTGINFIDSENTRLLYETDQSSVDYVLSIPMNYEPGIVYQYNDGAPHLISAAIEDRYGEPLSVFADNFLFKPLGITDWKWEAANDGITFGAFSIFMKPRDIARFGEMLLQNGKWENQQIVDSGWIAEATKPIVTMYSPGTSYGYYFWVYPAYGGYAAVGHGGQFIFVVPPKKLVVIYTAGPYTSGDMFDNFNELADLILKSCN